MSTCHASTANGTRTSAISRSSCSPGAQTTRGRSSGSSLTPVCAGARPLRCAAAKSTSGGGASRSSRTRCGSAAGSLSAPRKSHHARRVPIPPFLAAELAEQIRGRSAGALVFGDGVHHLNQPTVKGGWWVQSIGRAQAIDPGFPTPTIHDLRHTAASLAVSAGANVKAMQRMLGHASASMTLDVYADLFDEDLESVSMALDHARAAEVVQFLCSSGPAVDPGPARDLHDSGEVGP
ncbi:tyrosine-type recombinase/integrase [uncultured Amnibacterium sp.]|uniref:tyrosine-type recombinase/integrase n=1 Tax=uncultured Amnibacterium sp. TaxID=1631851 RepID=UPI0035CA0044